MLPIRKIRLSEELVSRPIPTLSDRQFVVDKSGLSDAEEKTQRELFWYREELFKCVRGSWTEVRWTHRARRSEADIEIAERWWPIW